MQVHVNYLAVLVAAIASYVIASVWYGVVFRKLWMQLTNSSDMKPVPKCRNAISAWIVGPKANSPSV